MIIKKYKNISKKNIKMFKYIFLSIFIFYFGFHFFVGGIYEENLSVDKKLTVSISEWKNIIHQMPLSKQIEENQNSYFEGKIPNIKGIYDFQFVSLGNNLKNHNTIDSYLAVPYEKIISLKNDDSIQYLAPYQTCFAKNDLKYSIFNIIGTDRILIFKADFNYSKKLQNNFILAPKSHIFKFVDKKKTANICDYMVLN